ncbi:hypothetical protein AgCh_008883 [Apium graveolens]
MLITTTSLAASQRQSLNSLKSLSLGGNYFSGEIPNAYSRYYTSGRIPKAIGATELVNNFSGTLPSEIYNLKMLMRINISANSLTGYIPASIANCTKLIYIDLSPNRVNSELSSQITMLQDLNALNLFQNQLSDEIPRQLGYMKGLTILDPLLQQFFWQDSGGLAIKGLQR